MLMAGWSRGVIIALVEIEGHNNQN